MSSMGIKRLLSLVNPSPRYPPPGQLVDIGGHRLHISITGKGGPTVVLEAGGASSSLDWSLVQPEIAGFTSVCSYDRAGFMYSEPGPAPRDARRLVDELHTLLTNAGIDPPYILVGHSFGGQIVRLFAYQYPDVVAGLVLVDAGHENLREAFPGWKTLEKRGEQGLRIFRFLARIGLLRLIGRLLGEHGLPPHTRKLPKDVRYQYIAVGLGPGFIDTALQEYKAYGDSDVQMSHIRTLGSLPLTVITHAIPDLFIGLGRSMAEEGERVWQELQRDLASQSTNNCLRVAERSGHMVHADQPDIIVEVVREMVRKHRQG